MGKKLLVVDDSATSRGQVIKALRGTASEFVEAENGDDAMAKLRAHPDICLVISDVNMPWKDGLELLAELRGEEQWKQLPVLMVTTELNPDQVDLAKKLGISGWLVKPIRGEMLLKAVDTILA